MSVVDAWSGDAPVPLAGGDCALAPGQAHLLYWMAGLCADSSPRYELRVVPGGPWSPPVSSPEVAVVARGDGSIALGPPLNTGGWFTWWSARQAAEGLAGLPDDSTLWLAVAPDADGDGEPETGRALYRGTVRGGVWQIAEASPELALDTLVDALGFVREIALHHRIPVRGADERRAFDASAEASAIVLGAVVWDGDRARLADPDERGHLMLATPVFRTRFAAAWACDPVDLGDDD